MADRSFQRKPKVRPGRTGGTTAPAPASGATAAALAPETLPHRRPRAGNLRYQAGPALALGSPGRGGGAAPVPAVQRKPAAPPATAPAAAPAATVAHHGSGEPLPAAVRTPVEREVGRDLSAVRVHSGPSDRESARRLGARAFTHGDHVWLGPGESAEDLGLMAHEAAHTVQQGERPEAPAIQRAAKTTAGGVSDDGDSYEGPEGKVDKRRRTVEVPSMRVPTFKQGFTPAPLELPKKTDEERSDTQRAVWEKAVKAGAVPTRLADKVTSEKAPRIERGGAPVYFLRLKGAKSYVLGPAGTIADRSLRPYWTPAGGLKTHDVDHKQELQLGGADAIGNLWLLESEANQSSGRQIRAERNKVIGETLAAAAAAGLWKGQPPDLETVRRSYKVTVQAVRPGLPVTGSPGTNYSLEQARDQVQQMEGLKVLTKKEIDAAGLQGSPDKLALFMSPSGGAMRQVDWGEGVTEKAVSFDVGPNFHVSHVSYTKGQGGKISGTAFRSKGGSKTSLIQPSPLTFDLVDSADDAVDYGGFVSKASVTKAARSALKAAGLSPVRIDDADLGDGGLQARGVIQATVPPIGGTEIDLRIDGASVTLSKTFTADEVKIPGPVKITGSSLTLGGGTGGIEVSGEVGFEIPRAGTGKLEGKGKTGEGLSLQGSFTFDPNLFDPPSDVTLRYAAGKLSGKGRVTIGKSRKLKGIKQAAVSVEVDGSSWKAEGSVEPDIPAVKEGKLTVAFAEGSGLTIAGELTFGSFPGLSGGSLKAEVAQEGDSWIVSGSGKAELAVPGLDAASVTATYRDGGFTAQGTLSYTSDFASGEVTAGATNFPVDPETGAVTEGGEPGNDLKPFGSGSVTLKFAPWLQGKVGVKVLPNAELQVSGEVSLPAPLDVFPEKKIEKQILSVGLDIPIVGVAVAGQRIGIFATISGSLSARASIGPGQLRDVRLGVDFQPARPEATKVTGTATFFVPAEAGVKLAVRAGLGAGIPIVSASLGLEVAGELGIKGEASASAQLDWTPTKGIELQADGRLRATPVFRFSVAGYATVEADLLIDTIELYSQRWELAAVEVGSGLTVGADFPIRYRQGEPFDLSLSDVTFIVPEIDPPAVLRQLVSQVV